MSQIQVVCHLGNLAIAGKMLRRIVTRRSAPPALRHLSAARPPTTPPPWRTPKPPERSAAEERAAAENAVIERLQREKQQKLEARVHAYEADPLRHEQEQRDYLLGVTSLWMLVPCAHGFVGLGSGAALVSAVQEISWHGNPFFLPPAEFEALRQAALLVCLLPTCTVSALSWRYPHWDAMADADRLGAKTFFVSLLAGNLPGFGPLPTQEAIAFPLVTFSVFGLSALSENLGHPIGRTWSHAAFRCAGGVARCAVQLFDSEC